jgi:hypothetical protein
MTSQLNFGWMIDIETLDTKHSAIVTEIGIKGFFYDPEQIETVLSELDQPDSVDDCMPSVSPELENMLPINAQQALGRTVSGDTLAWRAKFPNFHSRIDTSGSIALCKERLLAANAFMQEYVAEFDELLQPADYKLSVKYWGKGAGFEQSILTSLYESVDVKPLWRHSDWMDLRTVMHFAGFSNADAKELFGEPDHTGLEDCRLQIKILHHCMDMLARDGLAGI